MSVSKERRTCKNIIVGNAEQPDEEHRQLAAGIVTLQLIIYNWIRLIISPRVNVLALGICSETSFMMTETSTGERHELLRSSR